MGVLRQAAAERVGGKEDKQQEPKAIIPITASTPGDGVERHPAAEDGDGEGPDAEQQDPQQQRALVRPQVAATRYHTGSALLEFSAT